MTSVPPMVMSTLQELGCRSASAPTQALPRFLIEPQGRRTVEYDHSYHSVATLHFF